IVLAPMAAEESRVLSAPWRRLMVDAAVVAAVAVVFARSAGVDWFWTIETAACSAIALAAAILVHELLWPEPLSLRVRLAVAGALIPMWSSPRLTWELTAFPPIAPLIPLVPPAPRPVDLLALAPLLVIAARLHARARQPV